ncbi:DUF4062 domain-containing protein [Rhizobium sp. RMa-01]|uniref:DUF4062 domain-containing protein n=1 Tax=unclassified Rhizobium TaxID=2613769 RepID=UPI0008D91C31|nr:MULTISPECIES: DUF4062 domain-containing protein [unclassified Rhizobium]OHV27043.1 hypothetical protein BBJ66_01160 [Rhizobium sp. RSm-3]RVU10120.1 DUF4062 domain-containing protein [Rhizobium sp. RMa-01]
MDVRYQVFVSSTFVDLQNERSAVFQTLMEMDCIPAGMELFPAMDEEQWNFIKRVIDDCDYYILILGGRYGSVSTTGISYTEMEYDYAISRGLKVLAFVHEAPEDIPARYTDTDPGLREKLTAFRAKVQSNRLVRFWREAKELPGLVALSLNKTIKTYPATGWVRADKVSSEADVVEQNKLLKEVESLRAQLEKQRSVNSLPDLASVDEVYEVPLYWEDYHSTGVRETAISVPVTWKEIFSLIGPDLQVHPADGAVNFKLADGLLRRERSNHKRTPQVRDQAFKTIRVQLVALGLIQTHYTKTTKGDMALFWSLTEAGVKKLFEWRTVKASKADSTTEPSGLELAIPDVD